MQGHCLQHRPDIKRHMSWSQRISQEVSQTAPTTSHQIWDVACARVGIMLSQRLRQWANIKFVFCLKIYKYTISISLKTLIQQGLGLRPREQWALLSGRWEYGAPVILGASATNIKKLIIIKNKAIRIAYKLDSLSHTEDIHVIAIRILLAKEGFQDLTYNFFHSFAPQAFRSFQTIQNELRVSRIKRRHNTHVSVPVSVQQVRVIIETTSVVTVWLPQCQCQTSSNSAEPALAQRWRHWQYSRVRQQRWRSTGQHFSVDQSPQHVVTHQCVTELVSKWHYYTKYVTHTQNTYKQQNRLITHTYKQKRTKHQENMHKLKYTTHKPSKQQDKITDRI